MVRHTSTSGFFFRADEQTAQRIPLRDQGQTRNAYRSRVTSCSKRARPQRFMSLRQRQAIQAMLPQVRPLLMASIVRLLLGN